MSIPSYRAEGHGHNRKITVTFYGKVPPDHFSVMGVEYDAARTCHMALCGSGDGVAYACTSCGRTYADGGRPLPGEWCRCGARVVA